MVNIPISQETRLRRFALDYFTTLGAQVNENSGILRVELLPEHLAELEGRTGPRMSYWGAQQEEATTVLYLAFNQSDAAETPQAELVAPGSHRLEQMFASARRQGRLALLTLLPRGLTAPGNDMHRPYLLLHFRISCEGRYKTDQLYAVCVDLTDGSVHPEIARRTEGAVLIEGAPSHVVERKLDFSEAWEIACYDVISLLQSQDDGWARESLLALAQEKRLVDQFYAEQDGDMDRLETERQERLAEADRRARPRAIARVSLGAVLLVPELSLVYQ